jgi:hypothetical protein
MKSNQILPLHPGAGMEGSGGEKPQPARPRRFWGRSSFWLLTVTACRALTDVQNSNYLSLYSDPAPRPLRGPKKKSNKLSHSARHRPTTGLRSHP